MCIFEGNSNQIIKNGNCIGKINTMFLFVASSLLVIPFKFLKKILSYAHFVYMSKTFNRHLLYPSSSVLVPISVHSSIHPFVLCLLTQSRRVLPQMLDESLVNVESFNCS